MIKGGRMDKPRPMPNETLAQSTRKKRMERPRMAFDPYMKKRKHKIKNSDEPETDDLLDEEDPDDDDDDDGTTGTGTVSDDDETSGGDEDENELQQLDTPIKPIHDNPFEKNQKPTPKKEMKEQPKGPEKTQRSPWQQFIDFLVHGAHGAMIKNGDVSTKPSVISNILAGLGFKSFKKDVLLQEQAKKFWEQKSGGKTVDMRLLNTDKIDKKLRKEEQVERRPFLLAQKEQRHKDTVQLQKDLAQRIHDQIRSQNIQAQLSIERSNGRVTSRQKTDDVSQVKRPNLQALEKMVITMPDPKQKTTSSSDKQKEDISLSHIKMSKDSQSLLKQIQEARDNRVKNDVMQAQQAQAIQMAQQAQQAQQALAQQNQATQMAQQTQQALAQQALIAQTAQMVALSMAAPKPQPSAPPVLPPVPPKPPKELSAEEKAAVAVAKVGGMEKLSQLFDPKDASKSTQDGSKETLSTEQTGVPATLGENSQKVSEKQEDIQMNDGKIR